MVIKGIFVVNRGGRLLVLEKFMIVKFRIIKLRIIRNNSKQVINNNKEVISN